MFGNSWENNDDNSFDKGSFCILLNKRCIQIKTANITLVKTINLKQW